MKFACCSVSSQNTRGSLWFVMVYFDLVVLVLRPADFIVTGYMHPVLLIMRAKQLIHQPFFFQVLSVTWPILVVHLPRQVLTCDQKNCKFYSVSENFFHVNP